MPSTLTEEDKDFLILQKKRGKSAEEAFAALRERKSQTTTPSKSSGKQAQVAQSSPDTDAGIGNNLIGMVEGVGRQLDKGGAELGGGLMYLAGQASRLLPGDQSENPEKWRNQIVNAKPAFADVPQRDNIGNTVGNALGVFGKNVPAFLAGGLAGGAVKGVASKSLPRLGNYLAGRMAVGAAEGLAADTAYNIAKDVSLPSKGEAMTAAGIGAAFPLVGAAIKATGRGVGNARRSAAGVSPDIEGRLATMPKSKLQTYVEAAKRRAGPDGIDETSALGKAGEQLDEAAKAIKQSREQAGKAVSAAKEKLWGKKLDPKPVIKDISDYLAERVGFRIAPIKQGSKTLVLKRMKGALRDIPQSEQAQLGRAINSVRKVQNGKQASEVIKNLDDALEAAYDLQGQIGAKRDTAFTSALKMMRGKLNDAWLGGDDALEVAARNANKTFKQYAELEDELARLGGKRLQRAELLLKRVFSGDKSREGRGLLDEIKKLTGIDLVDDAVAARWATEQFGSQSSKSLLQQAIGGEIVSRGNLIGGTMNAIGGAAKGVLANPEKIVRQLQAPASREIIINRAAQAAGVDKATVAKVLSAILGAEMVGGE